LATVAETTAVIGDGGGNKRRDWRLWQKQTLRLATMRKQMSRLAMMAKTNIEIDDNEIDNGGGNKHFD